VSGNLAGVAFAVSGRGRVTLTVDGETVQLELAPVLDSSPMPGRIDQSPQVEATPIRPSPETAPAGGVDSTRAIRPEGSNPSPRSPLAAAAALASLPSENGQGSSLASTPRPPAPGQARPGARARAGGRATEEPDAEPPAAPADSTPLDSTHDDESYTVGLDSPPLEPDALLSAELRAVAGHLRDAIRGHTPEADPDLEPWVAVLRHAVLQDHRTPLQLAQAARYAHAAPDGFWRARVLSGRTLRQHAGTLLEQLAVAPTADRGAPVPVCRACRSVALGGAAEVPVRCTHRHTWCHVRVRDCAACRGRTASARTATRCDQCDFEGLHGAGLPPDVERTLARLGYSSHAGAPTP
jgi:hypothetical protein